MDSTSYVTLTRQSGLMREMQVVANNIANAVTTGYRQEGLVFSEFVQKSNDGPSVSMGHANTRNTSFHQGELTQTGGTFDLAIEGDGYFLIETPQGERLTRAGNFSPDGGGNLVTPDGYIVLNSEGAPVFVPPNAADVTISPDGTMSADGQPLGLIGIYRPIELHGLVREDGVMFRSDEGVEIEPGAKMLQGFLEGSNVDPISQLARMIEIQRAYEMGQSFLETEDQRIRNSIKSLIK